MPSFCRFNFGRRSGCGWQVYVGRPGLRPRHPPPGLRPRHPPPGLRPRVKRFRDGSYSSVSRWRAFVANERVREDGWRFQWLCAVKQISAIDRDLQRFLKTRGLSTQLHSITVVRFRLTAFVFDGRDGPVSKSSNMFNPWSQTRMFIFVVGGPPGLRPRVKRSRLHQLISNAFGQRHFQCRIEFRWLEQDDITDSEQAGFEAMHGQLTIKGG